MSLALTKSQISGEDPGDEAWKLVLASVRKMGFEECNEYIRRLPPHWRAVYTTLCLEGEVNNGGHHQFFWNSEGALNKETLADLQLLDAEPYVLLFEEALDIYMRHDYAGAKRDSENSWEAFTEAYKEKRMDTLDTAFYKAPKTIKAYLNDYIRSHRSDYCDTAETATGTDTH